MKAFLKENTIPVLLMTVLFSSIIYIYADSSVLTVLLLTLFSGVYSFVLFAVLDIFRRINKPPIAAAGVFGLFILSLLLGVFCIGSGYQMLYQWFFEPDKMNKIYVGYIFGLIFICGFVLNSAMYYFTRIRFRVVFVFLICMCPFSLYAKTFTDIPVIYIILITTLFFILLIMKQSAEISIPEGKNAAVLGGFIVVVVVTAAFIPKLEYAPYREQFDELITGINIGGKGQNNDFNSYSDSSSYSTSDDDEVVFTISGDNPGLIKRQCFNYYNYSDNSWSYYGEAETGYNNWEKYIDWEDPRQLLKDTETDVSKKITVITTQNGKIRAIYTAENTAGFWIRNGTMDNIYRTPMDEYFLSSNNPATMQYTLVWYELEHNSDFSERVSNMNREVLSTTQAGKHYLSVLSENEALYSFLLSEDVRRDCFGSESGFQKVGELAKKITSGCTNDLEKAKAIEDYLTSEQFIYDKDFSSVDSGVESFLFNYRRGVCSDYATAMVLLCRELGIKSRYVEGFLVQKYDPEHDYFYVTAADSHAYAQVWLDGYGWTDFDPTSPHTDGGYIDYTFFVFGGVVLFVALAVGFVFIAVPKIREYVQFNRIKKLRGREQLLLLFPKLNSFIHERLGKKRLVYTISELKTLTIEKYGEDISLIADDYEKAVYGGEEVGDCNYLPAYEQLIRAVKLHEKEERKIQKRK